MKLTTKQLEQIVTEEVHKVLHRENESESETTPEEIGKIMELLKQGIETKQKSLKKTAIMLIEDLFNVKHGKDFAIALDGFEQLPSFWYVYQGGRGFKRPKSSDIIIFSDNEQFLRTFAAGGRFNVRKANPYSKKDVHVKKYWEFYLHPA